MKKYPFLYAPNDKPSIIDDNPVMEWMLTFDEKDQLKEHLQTDSIENIIATLENIFKETQPPYSFHLLPLLANFKVKLDGNLTLTDLYRDDIKCIIVDISDEYHVNQLTLYFNEPVNLHSQTILNIKFRD